MGNGSGKPVDRRRNALLLKGTESIDMVVRGPESPELTAARTMGGVGSRRRPSPSRSDELEPAPPSLLFSSRPRSPQAHLPRSAISPAPIANARSENHRRVQEQVWYNLRFRGASGRLAEWVPSVAARNYDPDWRGKQRRLLNLLKMNSCACVRWKERPGRKWGKKIRSASTL